MEVQETDNGVIVSVRVRPNSGKFSLELKGDQLMLNLKSLPESGKANQEILSELPKLLRCDVRILSGQKSRKKLLLLEGISESELMALIG